MMNPMVKVGVVLCGCGRFDGSEVQEAVLTLLHLERGGADWIGLAPDAPQWAVCEHFEGVVVPGESRNQLREAARIARGQVIPLEQVEASELDALVLPGGSGAARNLCGFAEDGAAGQVRDDLAALLRSMHAARRPIGAICIAPAIVALALGQHRPRLTLGPAGEGPGAPYSTVSQGYALDRWDAAGMTWWAVTDAEPSALAAFRTALDARLGVTRTE